MRGYKNYTIANLKKRKSNSRIMGRVNIKRKYLIRRTFAMLILLTLSVLAIYLSVKYKEYKKGQFLNKSANANPYATNQIKTNNTVVSNTPVKDKPITNTNTEEKKPTTTTKKPTTTTTEEADPKEVTYIKGVLIVNKVVALPSTYNPGTNAEALAALKKMQAAAKKEGYSLGLLSGFRSYETQKKLYNSYVAKYGQKTTDTFSARPGHSEHQTGLAFDVGAISDSFGDTKEGKWLEANAYKYGFIIRYPKNKTTITGYKYEPWHIRYLGKTVAKEVFDSGLCLEEYLGIN